MASTSYKSRVIIKEHTAEQTDFAGTYNLSQMSAVGLPSWLTQPCLVEMPEME